MMVEQKRRKGLVSVIILYYKDKLNIESCILSVIDQSYKDIELIVVDNHSNDGVISSLKQKYKTFRFLHLSENRGFCGGNNAGLAHANGEFVLFLNSDVVLHRAYISKMVTTMRLNEKIGLVSGKILRFDRKTIDSAGLFISSKFGLVDRGFDKEDSGQYEIPEPIFGSCGAVFFCRASAIDEISKDGKLFDESYFAFMEDGDVSFRMHAFGYEVWYEPSAVAYHARGASSTGSENRHFLRKPYFYKYLALRNRYYFMLKNFPASFLLRNVLKLIALELLIFGYALLHPRLLTVYIDFAKSFRRALIERRELLLNRRVHINDATVNKWILKE